MADIGALLGAAGVGGAIGQAIVRLELDTSKYSAEMKAAQAQTTASAQTMGTTTSKFSALAQSALLGVGVAAVAGAALSVKAAVEANAAHTKLQNTFANNERLSDSSVAAFERQADSLRDLTGVDDEAIISAQALLGQFKLTGEKVMELTPLVVDLSAKMGIDLEAAAKAVGKATEGNTGALARYVGTIKEGRTPTETYANILEKLGRVQGFAAERAEDEPWRILSAQFEEIAEEVGQALIPALKGLTDTVRSLVPVVEFLAKGFKFLPIAQASEDIQQLKDDTDKSGKSFGDYVDILADTIPVLGHFVDVSDHGTDSLKTQRGVVGTLSEFYRDKYTEAIGGAQEATKKFSESTVKEIRAMVKDITESIDDWVFSLEELNKESRVTSQEFRKAMNEIEQKAEAMNQALKRISREKWINEDYVEFLSQLGPEFLIRFSKLDEDTQKKRQQQWLESTRKSKDYHDSLGKIFDALKNVDGKTTKHKYEVHYKYVGFDPTKPGMAAGRSPR